MSATPEPSHDEELIEKHALNLEMVAECLRIFGVSAGAELWFKLGLDGLPAMFDREHPDAEFRGKYERDPEDRLN